MKVMITGCDGLVGSESVLHFDKLGWDISGIDNNMRKLYFGPEADTSSNKDFLEKNTIKFTQFNTDIRDKGGISRIFKKGGFDLIIHCAAQPSHDLSIKMPQLDFEVNALGTLNLLEATRQFCPDAVFIHMSTNKVYGDLPNKIPLKELETRYDYDDDRYTDGIDETFPIDNSLHTPFGVSKLAADIMVQEYAKSFGLKTGVFRAGCITGSKHAGVELHGFLNYMVRAALSQKKYVIFGYKGKQVRDQVHASDLAALFYEFFKNPRSGEVYNIGGGRANSASLLESVSLIERISGKKLDCSYSGKNRLGDHICYITNLKKAKSHFTKWKQTYTLERMVTEIVDSLSGQTG